jgi:hypothetical protein
MFYSIQYKLVNMRISSIIVVFLVSIFFFYSCEVVGGIFKAGFMTAVILGVAVVVLIVWLVNRSRKTE